MAWIKSDSSLPSSPKFLDLVSRLKVGPSDAFWHLHHFWYWCSDHYPDGVLASVSDTAIALSAKWPGEPKVIVDALVSARFLDRGEGALFVHDWDTWRSDPVRLKDRRDRGDRRMSDKRPTNVGTAQEEGDTSGVILSFPVTGKTNGNDWPFTERRLQELKPLYPGVDVLLECRKALQWIKDNPTRRKTDKGMARFLNGWLERSQNRSRGPLNGQPPAIDQKRREELDARVDAIIGGRRPALGK